LASPKYHPKHAPETPTKTAATPLKPWLRDLIACAVIFVAVFAMFPQMAINGKVFSRGDDSESAASMSQFAVEESQVREYPMWCPYIFGGFPALAAGGYSNYERMGMPYALADRYLSPRHWMDVISERVLFLGGFGELDFTAHWMLALFLYAGLFTYWLMRSIGFNQLISLFSSILLAWNPYLISLATAAHGGKMMTFIYLPLVLLLTWNVMTKRRLLDLALLAAAFGWQIAVGGHTQILFYSFATVGLVYLVWLIMELRERPSIVAFKPALFIGIALLLGFAVGAVWYVPLLKFVGYSIRGMAPAFAENTQPGYSMADATMWSFHPQEILTFIVPSWFGLKSPYYWGDMPFTSSSFYFGVVPLLFAVLAFFGKKDRLFWGLAATSVFALLLSFGSHFDTFYGLFFNYFPFFNKFRTPSLVLLLVVLAGIIWAGYGLRFVLGLEGNEVWKKRLLIGGAICLALLILFVVAGGAFSGLFGSFSKAGEERQYKPEQIAQLRQIRFDMLKKDLVLSLLWLSLAFAAAWAFVSRKLKANWFVIAVMLISVIDLWRFSHQFFEPQSPGDALGGLRPNKVVEALKQDKSMFRVMPLGRIAQDNRWAAWEVPSMGGYHGAKMRSYQDYLDYVLNKGSDPRIPVNFDGYSALNCKYFVAEGQLPPELGFEQVAIDQTDKWVLYRNPKALDRAYFVDSIEVITDRKQVLQRLTRGDFAWRSMATVDENLPGLIAVAAQRRAEITEYIPHRVKLHAEVSGLSFMVLSDAYYAPGWEAFDNGQPTRTYLVNGYVRGVYLRPGSHDLEFRYTGKYEHRGVLVATVSHFLVWGLVVGCFLYERRRKPVAAA
jgi:hypothetical protein